jgi:hypothetical protein
MNPQSCVDTTSTAGDSNAVTFRADQKKVFLLWSRAVAARL